MRAVPAMARADRLCLAIGDFAHETVVLDVVGEQKLRGGEAGESRVGHNAFGPSDEKCQQDKSNGTSNIANVRVMIAPSAGTILTLGFGLEPFAERSTPCAGGETVIAFAQPRRGWIRRGCD